MSSSRSSSAGWASDVTLVEHNDHLLARLDRRRRHAARRAVRAGRDPRSRRDPGRAASRRSCDGVRLQLASGETLDAERLLVATGRRPNVDGLGLEQLGVEITPRGVTVDDRLRAGDGVWAIGDAAGRRAPHAPRQVPGARRRGEHRGARRRAPTTGRSRRRSSPIRRWRRVGVMDGDGVVTARYEIVGGRLSTYERPTTAGLRQARGGLVRGAFSSAPSRSGRRPASGSDS